MMNKSELIRAMANNANLTIKDATAAFDGLIDAITEGLKSGDKVQISGFGTFEIKERKSGERLINNHKNNQKQVYYVEPRYSISFKAASNFDYSVNENNFKIVSYKRNATLNRESRKPPVRTRTKRITDLINKANKRKGK